MLDMYGLDDAGSRGTLCRATACWPGGWSSAACGSCSSIHRGWDQHGNLPKQIRGQCKDMDQPTAALVKDLQAARPAGRHAGHLGRRIRPHRLQPGHADARQLRPRPSRPLLQRVDGRRRHQAGHHATARPTTTATTSSEDPVHIHDFNATILHCLGIDHTRLTYRFQGRDFRLTDVHGKVVPTAGISGVLAAGPWRAGASPLVTLACRFIAGFSGSARGGQASGGSSVAWDHRQACGPLATAQSEELSHAMPPEARLLASCAAGWCGRRSLMPMSIPSPK